MKNIIVSWIGGAKAILHVSFSSGELYQASENKNKKLATDQSKLTIKRRDRG